MSYRFDDEERLVLKFLGGMAVLLAVAMWLTRGG